MQSRKYRIGTDGVPVEYDPSARPEMPPFFRLAANFAKASAAETASMVSGDPPVAPEERDRRFALCRECPRFMPDSERCSHPKCGCFLRIKTAWRSQKCPEGKW
jgi:hypothetical protein